MPLIQGVRKFGGGQWPFALPQQTISLVAFQQALQILTPECRLDKIALRGDCSDENAYRISGTMPDLRWRFGCLL